MARCQGVDEQGAGEINKDRPAGAHVGESCNKAKISYWVHVSLSAKLRTKGLVKMVPVVIVPVWGYNRCLC